MKKNKSTYNESYNEEKDLYNEVYKHDAEADAFILAHVKEMSIVSYNDVTHIMPEQIKIKNVSAIISNVNLIKNENSRNLLNDYFNNVSFPDLVIKYNYKNVETLHSTIHKLKSLVKNRIIKKIEKDMEMELKKVSDKVLAKSIVKTIQMASNSNSFTLKLAKVAHRNKLNYKFYDEDISILVNKVKIVLPYLNPMDRKRISKYSNLQEMSPYIFKYISDICNKYRWVSVDGYLLPKIIDDSLTNILSYNELEKTDIFQ